MFLTQRFFIILSILTLFSALGVLWPMCYSLALAGLVVLCLALLLDAWRLWRSTRIEAWRECKERFSNAQSNALSIRVENESGHRVWLTVRDELPQEFRYHRAVFPVVLAAREGRTITYQLTPRERGCYEFGHVLVFARCHLGLLERKMALGKSQQVKVYPAFEHLERYELAAVSDQLFEAGQKRIRRAGNSTDFDQIKDYTFGDDYRKINWKASARSGRWMVNTYRDERSQPIWCLVDKGRSMQRTFADVSLIDYAINASLVLSYVALRRCDHPGLVTFGADVDHFVPAQGRPGQLLQILEALYAQKVEYAETDYSALAVRLSSQIRRRSLLVLFTDFSSRNALERQLPYLKRLARRHALLVVFFDDPEVAACAEKQGDTFTDLRMNALAADFCHEKYLLSTLLRQHGIYPLRTTPQRLSIDVINRYLELKRQQVI